jgi:APA family basic amino acid/polyamine antiporter
MASSRRFESPNQGSGVGERPHLARRVGLFDITMVVIGGIVGAGIFRNPHVVAMEVHQPLVILGAWLLGGFVALAGAFIYAELTAIREAVGGQYAFLKEAYHPGLAFVYGWALLLVIQTGGMAAVSVTFADYSIRLLESMHADGCVSLLKRAGEMSGLGAGKMIAVVALAILTIINCLGVRAGTVVQSGLTVLKMLAIAGLVGCGLFFVGAADSTPTAVAPDSGGFKAITSFGAAMVPVLFAYGGWQTACFIAGEVKNPKRNLPLGLLLGVLGVIALYLSVNWVCLRALGPAGLAATSTPAADVAKLALGAQGSFLISAGIVISTLGFLSQGMLTAPRVYFAMADDGLFFKELARVHPVTHVPVAAIALQGLLAVAIALTGQYEQILNYVVSVDFIFYGLTATCIFVFRRRDGALGPIDGTRVPGHPYTTIFFIACCWLVVVNSIYAEPKNSLIGLGLMLTGVPVYFFWKRKLDAR